MSRQGTLGDGAVHFGYDTVHILHCHRVKTCNRLVQQQQFARRAECPRQQDALLLSAGQLAVTALRQRRDAEPSHGVRRQPLLPPPEKGAESKPPQTARQHDFPHRGGEIPLGRRLLREVPDAGCVYRSCNFQTAARQRMQSQYCFHECAFSRSVLADNAEILSIGHREMDTFQYGVSLIAQRNVSCPDQHPGR